MSKIAYSSERREAFEAFRLLHGTDAALDRCDINAAQRWFSEQEERRVVKRMRWTWGFFVFLCTDVAFLTMLDAGVTSFFPIVGISLGGIAGTMAMTLALNGYEKRTLDDISQRYREDILSHFFMSDYELGTGAVRMEIERREREQAETVLARFNDPASAEGFGDGRADE